MPTPIESNNSQGSINGAPLTGKLWWNADSMGEAESLKAEYLAKGATAVDLHPDDDRPVVAMIITLERARAKDILGHDVQDHEWLDVSGAEAVDITGCNPLSNARGIA